MAVVSKRLFDSMKLLKGVTGNSYFLCNYNSSQMSKMTLVTKSKMIMQSHLFQSIRQNCDSNSDLPYPGSWSAKRHICTICGKSFFDTKGLNIHITKSHSAIVINKLRKDPLRTYKAIFGEDNFKSKMGNQLDFKNALTVSSNGTYAGIWKCWTDGTYGGPIKAIMRVDPKLSYAAAVELGAKIAGLNNKDLNSTRPNIMMNNSVTYETWTVKESRKSIDNLNKAEKQRKSVAQEIWSKCIDLKGTLGEVYLVEHRHIPSEVIPRLNFKFLPHRSLWETISYTDYDEHGIPYKVDNLTPSVVVPVRDVYGDISGIQRIFLDKRTGGKPKFKKQHKFSKGIVQGAAGIVQSGEPGQTLFIVEGPETGASVAAVVDTKSPVLASLSIVNFNSMADVIISYSPKRIILAADNDAAKENSQKIISDHVSKLQLDIKSKKLDIPFKVIMPELKGHKDQNIDWNDVLKLGGIESLHSQIRTKVDQTYI